jgi:hypothetical protein
MVDLVIPTHPTLSEDCKKLGEEGENGNSAKVAEYAMEDKEICRLLMADL